MEDWKERLRSFITAHRWAVGCVLAGLIIGILMLTINFWRTLLLCVIVGLCLLFGVLMDRGGIDTVRAFLDRILPKR